MRITARLIITILPVDGIDGEEFIALTSPTGTNKTVEKFGNDSPTVFIYRINGIPASMYPRCSVKR